MSIFKSRDYDKATNFELFQTTSKIQFNPEVVQQKKIIVYFWATWCTVCKVNLPLIKSYQKIFSSQNTAFLFIEEGDSPPEAIEKYAKENGIGGHILLANEELLRKWKIQGFPTTVFISSDHKIKFVDTGIINPISFFIRFIFT